MSDRLHAATQAGGRPDGWPDDVWSLIVWAAIGSGAWPGTTPEADIADQRQRGGDPETVLSTLAPGLEQQPAPVVIAAAWTGLARVATERRNQTLQAIPSPPRPDEPPVNGAISDRQLGRWTDLSHTIIGRIRRDGRTPNHQPAS